MRTLAPGLAAVVAMLALAACSESEPDAALTATPRGTAATPPAATATATSEASATATSTPVRPTTPAPTNVRLSGRLPDTSATVPPGEGEAGRVTVEWDAEPGATGFRIYLEDCEGKVRPALEVGPDDRMYGPLQPCRPGGNVGVSALTADGESEIAWAAPGAS